MIIVKHISYKLNQ